MALGGDDDGRPGIDHSLDDVGQPRLLGRHVADSEGPQDHGLGQRCQQRLQAGRGDARDQVDHDDVVTGVGGGVLPTGSGPGAWGPLPRGASGGQRSRIGGLETGEGPRGGLRDPVPGQEPMSEEQRHPAQAPGGGGLERPSDIRRGVGSQFSEGELGTGDDDRSAQIRQRIGQGGTGVGHGVGPVQDDEGGLRVGCGVGAQVVHDRLPGQRGGVRGVDERGQRGHRHRARQGRALQQRVEPPLQIRTGNETVRGVHHPDGAPGVDDVNVHGLSLLSLRPRATGRMRLRPPRRRGPHRAGRPECVPALRTSLPPS